MSLMTGLLAGKKWQTSGMPASRTQFGVKGNVELQKFGALDSTRVEWHRVQSIEEGGIF